MHAEQYECARVCLRLWFERRVPAHGSDIMFRFVAVWVHTEPVHLPRHIMWHENCKQTKLLH